MPYEITPAEVKHFLEYDPASGVFVWKPRPLELFPTKRTHKIWNTRYAGKVAGSLKPEGYLTIRFFQTFFYAHRLAWLYMTGEWPTEQTDHINGNRDDNRWQNLREATPYQNQCNKRVQKNSKSGLKGVSFHKQSYRWTSKIKVHGKSISLGYYLTAEAAGAAYALASAKHHGGFGRAA
jgi:hypothetical protein